MLRECQLQAFTWKTSIYGSFPPYGGEKSPFIPILATESQLSCNDGYSHQGISGVYWA